MPDQGQKPKLSFMDIALPLLAAGAAGYSPKAARAVGIGADMMMGMQAMKQRKAEQATALEAQARMRTGVANAIRKYALGQASSSALGTSQSVDAGAPSVDLEKPHIQRLLVSADAVEQGLHPSDIDEALPEERLSLREAASIAAPPGGSLNLTTRDGQVVIRGTPQREPTDTKPGQTIIAEDGTPYTWTWDQGMSKWSLQPADFKARDQRSYAQTPYTFTQVEDDAGNISAVPLDRRTGKAGPPQQTGGKAKQKGKAIDWNKQAIYWKNQLDRLERDENADPGLVQMARERYEEAMSNVSGTSAAGEKPTVGMAPSHRTAAEEEAEAWLRGH